MNRSARIREWLATQHIPATARDIMQAVEPRGEINTFCASLSAMHKKGLVRANKVNGRLYYSAGRAPKSRRDRRPTKTGRAHRVRELLADGRGYTVAEIRAKVDPGTTSSRMSASLSTLFQQGHIARAQDDWFTCYALTQEAANQALADLFATREARKAELKRARQAAAAEKRRTRAPKTPRAKPARAPKAKPSPKLKAPPVRDVPRGMPPPPTAEVRAAIASIARSRPPVRPAQVTCALDGVPERQRAASERIAADIAEFQARGGKIERLGPTQFFTRIEPANGPLRRTWAGDEASSAAPALEIDDE